MLLDKLKIEFISCFIITFFLTTSSVNVLLGINSQIGYAISSFFLYAILTWTAKEQSGALFNPMITISQIITKHIDLRKGMNYLLFQLFGIAFGICLVEITQNIEIMEILKT